MRIKLSECEVNPEKINALENYCKKNNKLIALRDMKGRLLAVGLSIKALQISQSKEGFNHYNVIYKDIAVVRSLDETKNISEKDKKNYEKLKQNNFVESYPIYDVYISVYEGMIKHPEEQNNKREEYWYKCYLYYQKFQDRFSIFDLINRSSK